MSSSSIPPDSTLDPSSVVVPPRARQKRRRKMRPAVRYAIVVAVVGALGIAAQFLVHMARTEPRDTRAIAERELQLNTLQPGERVIRSVSVFQRPAIEYFRARRGILVLTDRRLVYLGLEPRDLLAAPDLPPTFEERDFPLDTLVRLSSGHTFFGIAHAIVIATPGETTRLGVPSASQAQAELMILSTSVRRDLAVNRTAQMKQMLAAAEAQRRAAETARRSAKYYTVRRGDALGGIATIWNTTTDTLRAWNRLPSNIIRVGESLLVRPALKS